VEPDQLQKSRIVLWDGFCSVHQEFNVEHIVQARRKNPQVKVIVHPECKFEVARQADYVGSTDYIIRTIRAAGPGSSWVVGTEINLVKRLGQEMASANIDVKSLNDCGCPCETMYRIDPKHLAWLMETLVQHVGAPESQPLHNQIIVPAEIKIDARKALETMLEITAVPG